MVVEREIQVLYIVERTVLLDKTGMGVRLNKFSDEQFIQPRICAEASQILLIAEQNRSIPSENSEILLAASA